MAESENTGGGSGSNDRATVALVAEMVKVVSEQVTGLRELTRSQHVETQRRLDDVSGLPQIVTGLTESVRTLDKRQTALEDRMDKSRDYRMGTLPMVLLALGMFVLGMVTLIVNIA